MKLPKIIRPEIEVEYQNLYGLIIGLFVCARHCCKRITLDLKAGEAIVSRQKIWCVPKFKFVKGGE